MGAQQSKPKRRQELENPAQFTTKTSPSPTVTKQSSFIMPLSTTPSSKEQSTSTLKTTPTTSKSDTIDNNNNVDSGLHRFVEQDSINLHVYLDQHTVTDLFVDGDTDDIPDFYDVDSTISSQHSALFSTLSSVASSSASSISSIHHDDKSPSILLRQSSDPTRLPLSAVFGREESYSDRSNLQQNRQRKSTKQQRDYYQRQNLIDSIQLASFDDLMVLAEQNDRVELSYCVAVCYYRGWFNTKVDLIKAFHWFKRAAALGTRYQNQEKNKISVVDNNIDDDYKVNILPLVALAQYRTGKMLLQNIDNTINNNKDAWYYLDLAANNGNNRAEYLVGWKAEKLENNPQKAFDWYLSSCRHGLVEAQTALGCLLINHATADTMALDGLSISGVSSSVMSRDQQALCLLEGAADKNNLTALLQLGSLYAEGHQVKKNVAQAIVYYKKASALVDLDNPNYQVIHYLLGREYRYLDGDRAFDSSLVVSEDGTTHCHQLALHHFKLACTPSSGHITTRQHQSGYVLAQRALAHMYYIDTNKDPAIRLKHKRLAHDLFKKAAIQNDITAMGFLGEQYERGSGCTQDLEMAIHYYRASMNAGSLVGELALALLLHQMERYQEALAHFTRLAKSTSKKPYGANGDRSSYQKVLEHDIARVKCRSKFMVARYRQNGWGGCMKDPLTAFNDFVLLANVDGYEHAYYWVAMGYKNGISVESSPTTTTAPNNGDGKRNKKKNDPRQLDGGMITAPTTLWVVQPDLMLAFEYFEKAATLCNDQEAQMEMAKLCSNGFKYTVRTSGGDILTKTYKDRAGALKWYQMAAQQHGNALAYYCAGIYYAKGLAPLQHKDLDKAFSYYEASAKQGYTLAMVQLAQLIIQETALSSSVSLGNKHLMINDNGGDNDHAVIGNNNDTLDNTNAQQRYKMAFDWLTSAAEKQDPAAYRELAHMYEKGYYPHHNLSEKVRYQQGFTLLGHPLLMNDAQAWCAKSRYYENGWFVDQDLDRSVHCLEQSVKLNYVKAELYIAELYQRNGQRALALAKYNDIIKKYPLRSQVGWFARLDRSRMVVKSSDGTSQAEQHQVLGWLHDMADQNAGEASIEPLLLLAMCYELGIGTPQNITEAKQIYEKAINIDTTKIHWSQQDACFRLAKLCVDQQLYDAAFGYFMQLKLKLSCMNHHSPETRRQARQVRYYLGYLIINGYGTARNEQEGIEWLTQAADEGDGDACYTLGKLYLDNKQHDDDENVQQATKRFDQGVSASHPGCMRELALIIQQEHQADKDWDGIETYELLERAQRLGDVEALVRLAVAVQYGLGTTIKKGNITMALGWYRTAAQLGHPKAAVYAAVAFHELQQHELAVEWFQMQPDSLVAKVWLAFYRLKGVGGLILDPVKAFDQLQQVVTTYEFDKQRDVGDRNALGLAYFLVGRCFEEGEGTAQDHIQAMIYYDLARQRTQDVEATYRLGILLFQRQSEPGRHDSIIDQQQRAFECFDAAASKGNLEAKYMVGVYHARGLGGMVPDKAAAHIHLQRAIRDGHTRAILELGHVLWSAKNYTEAIDQFKKAAELKIPEASYHLGRLYHEGVRDRSSGRSGGGDSGGDNKGASSVGQYAMIIPQDYHQAFFYFMKAAKQAHPLANMMVGIYYQEGYDAAFHPIDFTEALHYYNLAYEYQGGHVVELAIAKLLHTMAEQENDVNQANKYHQMALHWFLRASPIKEVPSQATNDTNNDNSNTDQLYQPDDLTEQRLYEAQMMVAFYYLNGWGGIEKNCTLGFNLLLDAANNGASDAFMDVARCYENGIGVDADKAQAYQYWSFAADMNLVEAMDRISVYYREGWGGLEMDQAAADAWESKATILRNGDSDRDSSVYTTTSTSTY
ncbi:hypothetical protein BC941DRAFT_428040 [Chlamydoabsidia padenii]|nr:hypothetical protein BC941DRAFT_428040 [Chlamydoabsidia padenii]